MYKISHSLSFSGLIRPILSPSCVAVGDSSQDLTLGCGQLGTVHWQVTGGCHWSLWQLWCYHARTEGPLVGPWRLTGCYVHDVFTVIQYLRVTAPLTMSTVSPPLTMSLCHWLTPQSVLAGPVHRSNTVVTLQDVILTKLQVHRFWTVSECSNPIINWSQLCDNFKQGLPCTELSGGYTWN